MLAPNTNSGRMVDPLTGRPKQVVADPNMTDEIRRRNLAHQENVRNAGSNAFASKVIGYNTQAAAATKGANDYATSVMQGIAQRGQPDSHGAKAGADNYARTEMARIAGVPAQRRAQEQAAQAGSNNYAIQEMLRLQQEALAQNPNGAM